MVGLGGSVKRVSNELGIWNRNLCCSLQVRKKLLHWLVSWLRQLEQPNWDKSLILQRFVFVPAGNGCCPLTAWPSVLMHVTRQGCQAGTFYTSSKVWFPLALLGDA